MERIFGSALELSVKMLLPHNLIKDKLIDLIENTLNQEGSPYLACNDSIFFYFVKAEKLSCMVL